MANPRSTLVFVAILVVIASFAGFRWLQTARQLSPVSHGTNASVAVDISERPNTHGLGSSVEHDDTGIGGVSPPQPPLTVLKAITPESPSNQAYDTFVGLKTWLAEDPEAIAQAVRVLLDPNDGSASQKRQRSILYGALAETRSPAAAEALIEVLKQARHEDDAIQAAAALGDHPAPPEHALDILWKLGRAESNPGQNTAILAYGSVAHRLGSAGEQIAAQLISAAGEARTTEQKVEFLAVMGNHGSPQYLSFLQQSAQDSDEDIRAAAVYGARYHKADEAGAFVAGIGIKDPSDKVKAEAIRSLTMQLDQRRDFDRVAAVALSTAKEDVQLEAVRVLKAAIERSPQPDAQLALEKVLKNTKSNAVRAFISQEDSKN